MGHRVVLRVHGRLCSSMAPGWELLPCLCLCFSAAALEGYGLRRANLSSTRQSASERMNRWLERSDDAAHTHHYHFCIVPLFIPWSPIRVPLTVTRLSSIWHPRFLAAVIFVYKLCRRRPVFYLFHVSAPTNISSSKYHWQGKFNGELRPSFPTSETHSITVSKRYQ